MDTSTILTVILFPLSIIGTYFSFLQTLHIQQGPARKRFFVTTILFIVVSIIIITCYFFKNEIKELVTSEIKKTAVATTTVATTVDNLLSCLGNTGGEQRHMQLSGCLDGVSLPATTTAQQIIDILGTIPRDSTQWHDDLVDLLKNNKITISGEDATRLLSTFGSESRRSYLIGILCYIKRPISDSDKNELLKGIDPMYVSYVRQQLAEPTNLPCEN